MRQKWLMKKKLMILFKLKISHQFVQQFQTHTKFSKSSNTPLLWGKLQKRSLCIHKGRLWNKEKQKTINHYLSKLLSLILRFWIERILKFYKNLLGWCCFCLFVCIIILGKNIPKSWLFAAIPKKQKRQI